MNYKKLIFTSVLEVIFTILIIILSVFAWHKVESSWNRISNLSYDINSIENNLTTQNLTTYNEAEITKTLNDANSVLQDLFYVKYFLPLVLIILSFMFYFFIWKIINNVSVKNYLIYSILPLILLFISFYFILSYIGYYFGFSDSGNLVLLIISLILLIVSYYFMTFNLVKSNLKNNFRKGLKNFKKIGIYFIFNIITNLGYFILLFIVFVLIYTKQNYILASGFLFVLILIINLQRIHLVEKIKHL